jgi:hypothetical protein
VRTILAIGALCAAAALCGVLSYGALANRPSDTGYDRWQRAAGLAQRADQTKAELPAIRARDRATQLFLDLAGSGAPPARSRAAAVAGVLQIRNALADPTRREALLVGAARSLRRAVRLDPTDDDAAYDLELLLARASASGHPIPMKVPSKSGKVGNRGAGDPGTGY